MGMFLRFLEVLLSRKGMLVMNAVSALLISVSLFFGFRSDFYNEILLATLTSFGGGSYTGYLQLKPVTLLLYSSLAFVLTLSLTLRNLLLQLAPDARLNLAVLLLVPEAVSFYEFFNGYAFWIERGFVQDAYFIFTTKFTGLFLFLLIGLQLILLKER